MKLELKNIKHHAGMSEETYCYEATLYRDGKRVGRVLNRGTGGADECHFDRPSDWAEIDAWCRSNLPKEKFSSGEEEYIYEASLDSWCHQQVTESIYRSEFKKAARGVLCQKPDRSIVGFASAKWSVWQKPENLMRFKAKYPDYVVLNELPFDVAFRLWKEAAEELLAQ